MTIIICCADCGKEGGVSLKACKSCMLVKYCNPTCQRNHWPKHKKQCKERAAELHDEALFKDPPAKEDCPICFLPIPDKLISCVSLPPATRSSVPIYDFAIANEELDGVSADGYYPCCGKNICRGCVHSFAQSGNEGKCPFCNSDRGNKTVEDGVEDNMKRAAANDPASIFLLATHYHLGRAGFQQDNAKATELYTRAAELGCSKAHSHLADVYHQGGDLKKTRFHFEAAAMAGNEFARCIVGVMQSQSGNMERAVKHWAIAASAGQYDAMHHLRILFGKGFVSRESIDSTLISYNNSCAEMRSDGRDAAIRAIINRSMPRT